ncbi:helix-turn-helix transcriptional regulator [Mangrovibacterium marinum]|uniref:ArsR family transcriptional regulator n=1 Tax=Mangrovibacterium marinum TaxID=1639118 RepID=A0A2T5C1Q0_9BACT|nr:metalloregulator ArsR/SmtB family transcription factor [Mangrovibacterium marinum]PTN08580.1 ArsR family transcriptional regulator [Mangrovibacterium marinum]
MTTAKVELFDDDLQHTASYFKALGHPARLAILKYLAESKSCISGDITNELPLSRTTVNQHLSELKNLGLIKGTTQGAKVNYCLNTEKVMALKQLLGDFLGAITLPDNFSCNK